MNRKRLLTFVVGLVIGIAGIVAGSQLSNILQGTTTVSASLILTGDFPASHEVGTPQISSFFVKNTGAAAVLVHLEFILSKSGIGPNDASVTIAGNPVSGICDADSCLYNGSAFNVPSGVTVQADIGLLFYAAGQYVWTLQAKGDG